MKTISQSLIKDMIGEYCEYYLKLNYIDGLRTEATSSMEDGLYFESELIGSSRDGKFELPKLKNGGISKRQKDVDEIVTLARKVIKELGIVIGGVQVHKKKENRNGHIDCEAAYSGKQLLVDVKFTGLSFDQYSKELKWSPLASNLMLQAKHYQSLYDQPLSFLFLVFSSKGWSRVFEVPYDGDEIEQHSMMATAKLLEFNSLKFKPATYSNMCATCRLKDQCDKRNYRPKVEYLNQIG